MTPGGLESLLCRLVKYNSTINLSIRYPLFFSLPYLKVGSYISHPHWHPCLYCHWILERVQNLLYFYQLLCIAEPHSPPLMGQAEDSQVQALLLTVPLQPLPTQLTFPLPALLVIYLPTTLFPITLAHPSLFWACQKLILALQLFNLWLLPTIRQFSLYFYVAINIDIYIIHSIYKG